MPMMDEQMGMVDPEYDFELQKQMHDEYREQERIEKKIELDNLRMQVDELKAQLYERTAISRDDHRLLERFDYMMRGRFISEPVAMRMIEIIRDRMERSPTTAMEQKLRALEAEKYMMELKKVRFVKNDKGEIVNMELDNILKDKEFIDKEEMEV